MVDPRALTLDEAAELLRWQSEMGVDVALGEEPADWFGLSGPAAPAAPVPARQAVVPTPAQHPTAPRAVPAPFPRAGLLTAPPEAVVTAAREQARSAPSLEALRAQLDAFEGCALKATASRLVFMDGVAGARIMFVGEAPGREEDAQGIPFVGPSGRLLDRMLAAIGLQRSEVAIANLVPWRPPGNRTPTVQEAAVCKPFLERQIELVGPEVLVCLGAPSTHALLGGREGILKMRGRWSTYDEGGLALRAMATLHPAYLLRQPVQKRLAWRDFRAIRAALQAA